MTRKRFNNLMRYWFYLVGKEAKKYGKNPVKIKRTMYDAKMKIKGGSYLKTWQAFRNLQTDEIKKKMPIK